MIKKAAGFKPKGMNRDLSVSAFNPEFTFENINLRLSTNDGNTLMSWVNEKGTLKLTLTIDKKPWGSSQTDSRYADAIEGVPIGTAVINNTLVVFSTKQGTEYPDYIYSFEQAIKANTGELYMKGKLLYNGILNFDAEHPIETLVSFETDKIQKVYWTDGLNQPRVINIKTDNDKLEAWHKGNRSYSYFDFLPLMNSNEILSVTKNDSQGGLFAPGVIQYCFTYFNKHGQQSNIVAVSPLYYLTFNDRGAAANEMVSGSFKIEVSNLDTNFDYIRFYSIQRTSLNDTPIVKVLEDIHITLENALERTVHTEDDTTYTLPISNNQKIRYVTLDEEHQFTVELGNITENTSNNGYSNTSALNLIGYTNNGGSIQSGSFMSLQEFITHCANGDAGYGRLIENDYYGGLCIRDLYSVFTSLAHRFGYAECCLGIGENIISEVNYLTYLIYSYAEGSDKWYFTEKLPDVSVVWNSPMVCVDNGSIGYTIDPTELLYVGGKEISALTMSDKDNTLFLGNIRLGNVKQSSDEIINLQEYYLKVLSDTEENIEYKNNKNITIVDSLSGVYSYDNLLKDKNLQDITTFKGGEIYRFGFQLQKCTGEWSEPIFLGDKENPSYPNSFNTNKAALVTANYMLSTNVLKRYLNTSLYKRVRPVVVYPEFGDRQVLCQGVINPTVFNVEDRLHNSPHSQASWFFRPYVPKYFMSTEEAQDTKWNEDAPIGTNVEFCHYASLYTVDTYTAPNGVTNVNYNNNAHKREIQNGINSVNSVFDEDDEHIKSISNSNSQFFVDQGIVTLNSPEIEFDNNVQAYKNSNVSLHIIGAVPITSNCSHHSISLNSSMLEIFHNNSDGTSTGTGKGEMPYYVECNYRSTGSRLCAEFMWQDCWIHENYYEDADGITSDVISNNIVTFLIHPWHRTGPLNNDWRPNSEASSVVKNKKLSNLLFSCNTVYLTDSSIDYTGECQIHLKENNGGNDMYRFNTGADSRNSINYYPNVDKILYNNRGYRSIWKLATEKDRAAIWEETAASYAPVQMKYKSNSHAVFIPNSKDTSEGVQTTVMPCGTFTHLGSSKAVGATAHTNGKPYWWDSGKLLVKQPSIELYNKLPSNDTSWLWLGELRKEVTLPFGGTGKEAIKNNKWVVGGDAVNLYNEGGELKTQIPLKWTYGDTYYQRYDCLKTYAYSSEDANQVVEILSFMCETHQNLDGRYDKNRGQKNNDDMTPEIFNHINPVYSQKDNYFISQKTGDDKDINSNYENYVTNTKQKQSGADIDLWTNITLASSLELDGDKGKLSSIQRYNNQLLAFQDTGISQILYNEDVQISSAAGVPIELASSGKVQGKRYFSDTVGCSNKWSICNTPLGIYFTDSYGKNIYLFNGQLSNLSSSKGFNSWAKSNIPSDVWDPKNFKGFVTYYDKLNQDILFINNSRALAWSEKLENFTSFYNYGNTPYFINMEGKGIWIKPSTNSNNNTTSSIYLHNGGNYCNFFGKNYPYSMTLIGNPEPLNDKVFTNLEFRASVDGEGYITIDSFGSSFDDTFHSEDTKYHPYTPFDSLETWNEYQHGYTKLKYLFGHPTFQHNNSISHLSRKYRIWRCDIPRDKEGITGVFGPSFDATFQGKSQYSSDRMRNPWLYLRLNKDAAIRGKVVPRTEIHDIVMSYFS